MGNSSPKHHFVPEKILKFFASGKKQNKIFFIDKKSIKEIKLSSPKKVARIHNYYDYPDSAESLEDDFFNKIDSDAPPVIKKIVHSNNVDCLSSEDKGKLIKYISSQICRVPNVKNQIEKMEENFKKELHESITILKRDLKTDFLNVLLKNTSLYIDLLSNKEMELYINNGSREKFITSDNPVIAINEKKEHHFISLDIHSVINYDLFAIPISPNHALFFYDKGKHFNLKEYAGILNRFQFAYSERYIYSGNEYSLDTGMNQYYLDAYDYLNAYSNGEEDLKIHRGEPVVIEKPVLKFTDDVKEMILEKLREERKLDLHDDFKEESVMQKTE
ncbi:UNVERIFIED_ORG: hypothetical protein M2402_004879 [Rahnella aquatilis]